LPTQVSALYATPEYLDNLEVKITASSLRNADFIGFNFMNRKYINGLNAFGIPIDQSNFKVICNNQNAHWEMTKHGIGIGIMPIDIGDKEKSVTRVLPKKLVFKREVWLVAHRELRTNRRLKTVFDFLSDNLK
jgi:DNA-binding transcriptional LysR family regulator